MLSIAYKKLQLSQRAVEQELVNDLIVKYLYRKFVYARSLKKCRKYSCNRCFFTCITWFGAVFFNDELASGFHKKTTFIRTERIDATFRSFK